MLYDCLEVNNGTFVGDFASPCAFKENRKTQTGLFEGFFALTRNIMFAVTIADARMNMDNKEIATKIGMPS